MNKYEKELFLNLVHKDVENAKRVLLEHNDKINVNKVVVTEDLQEYRNSEEYCFSFVGHCFLSIACVHGLVEIVNELLGYGASFNITSRANLNPAYIAYQYQQIDVLKYFINAKLPVHSAISSNYVHILVMQNNLNTLQELFNNTLLITKDFIHKNIFGDNILHVAILFNFYEIAECILKNIHEIAQKYLMNEQNCEGNTPMHVACLLNRDEMLDLMMHYEGWNFGIHNVRRYLPIDISRENENVRAIEIFHNNLNLFSCTLKKNKVPCENKSTVEIEKEKNEQHSFFCK